MANGYALNSQNGMFLDESTGQISRASDGAEVTQHVRSRLLFYLGESPLDTTQGVDYFGQILIKPANLPVAESLIKFEILATPGMNELTEFGLEFDSATRKLTVSWEGNTTFGTVSGSTVNV